jgi:hypothetical protein
LSSFALIDSASSVEAQAHCSLDSMIWLSGFGATAHHHEKILSSMFNIQLGVMFLNPFRSFMRKISRDPGQHEGRIPHLQDLKLNVQPQSPTLNCLDSQAQKFSRSRSNGHSVPSSPESEVLTRWTTNVIQVIQSYENVVLDISAEPIFCLLQPFSSCFQLPPIIPVVYHRAHHSVRPFVFLNYFRNRTDILPGISRFLVPPMSPLDFGSSKLTFLCSDAQVQCIFLSRYDWSSMHVSNVSHSSVRISTDLDSCRVSGMLSVLSPNSITHLFLDLAWREPSGAILTLAWVIYHVRSITDIQINFAFPPCMPTALPIHTRGGEFF